jgi:hypothetical protein
MSGGKVSCAFAEDAQIRATMAAVRIPAIVAERWAIVGLGAEVEEPDG